MAAAAYTTNTLLECSAIPYLECSQTSGTLMHSGPECMDSVQGPCLIQSQ